MIPSFDAGSRHDEESRAFQQGRLAFFGMVGTLFFLALAGGRTAVLLGRPEAEKWGLYAVNQTLFGVAVALATVWQACRRGRRSARTLRWIDASGLLVVGAALGSLGFVRLAFIDTTYPMVIAVALTLLTRAVIVPSSAPRTLGLSAAAGAPAVAAAVCHAVRTGRTPGLEAPGAMDVVIQAGWLLAAIGLAALASRVTYGLRAQVREARQVGQYTLEEKLGEGGMGVVYRAHHARLKRPTAVKLLSPGKVGAQTIERFEREVQITAGLTHPNTVAVFDYGRTLDGVFYYAMEYLEGISLEALVPEDGPQPPGRVVHVMRQVCGALAEAHACGLVHRDIKPANVILCERGGVPDVAKVVDFGLVKDLALPGAATLTQSNVILGTPLYMAPEALVAPEQVGPRTDLYGLGAVGFFLLTGSPVFTGHNAVEVLGHHLHTRPARPSERLGRPLPRALEDLLLLCLEKDPDRRPASARGLLEALDTAGVEPWTEADARGWWTKRAAHRVSPSPGPA